MHDVDSLGEREHREPDQTSSDRGFQSTRPSAADSQRLASSHTHGHPGAWNSVCGSVQNNVDSELFTVDQKFNQVAPFLSFASLLIKKINGFTNI